MRRVQKESIWTEEISEFTLTFDIHGSSFLSANKNIKNVTAIFFNLTVLSFFHTIASFYLIIANYKTSNS